MQFVMNALSKVTYYTPVAGNYAAATAANRGMLFACWAIVIVLLAMAFVFLRSNKKGYAVAILPLTITPFVHIFSGLLAQVLRITLSLPKADLRVVIDLTAGLVSCLLLGLAAQGIQEKRYIRRVFFWCCAVFVVILTLVLVTNTLAGIAG